MAFWVFLAPFLLLFTGAPQVETHRPDLELDHIFVAVPGPEVGSPALEEAGFLFSASNPHPGQGTMSRGILFENAYLELIWLTDPEEAESPPIQRTRLKERTDPSTGACPFGIGLRSSGEGEARLPFESWEYRPPYLPNGMSFQMGVSSEDLSEPLVFFLPWLSAPTWPVPEHPNGASRITRVELMIEGEPQDSEPISALSTAGIASFRSHDEYFMEVELDEGRSDQSLDLRPEVPLRISW
jgi:hypothetical protein